MYVQSLSSRPLGADLHRLWWLIVVRGLLIIAFGVFAVGFTRTAVDTLITVLGVLLIFDGLFTLVTTALARRRLQRGSWLAGQGIFAVLAGVVALLLPGLAAWTVLSVILVWGFVAVGLLVGIGMLRFAMSIRSAGGGFGKLGIAGVIVTALAVALLVATVLNPAGIALGVLWIIGFGAILLGLSVVAWGFVLRRATRGGGYEGADETVTILPPLP